MTILTTGAYDLPAAADRNRTALMLAKSASGPLAVFDGVHSGLALTKTTGMGFSLEPGRAAVNGASAADGTFTVAVTASETGAFTPGDAAKDRIDLIVLQTYPGNPSATGVMVEVVTGAVPASGEPVVPATPAGALALYQVRIGAGVSAGNGGWNTSQVTDVRRPIGVPQFIDYSPTWANFSNIGTGAIREGRYRVDGDKVSVNVHLKGGTGATLGSSHLISFSLPIPAKAGYVYYGNGAIHHPNRTGLAYDLRVMSTTNAATIHATASNGALIGLSDGGYPFAAGTELYANLEYFIDPQ